MQEMNHGYNRNGHHCNADDTNPHGVAKQHTSKSVPCHCQFYNSRHAPHSEFSLDKELVKSLNMAFNDSDSACMCWSIDSESIVVWITCMA